MADDAVDPLAESVPAIPEGEAPPAVDDSPEAGIEALRQQIVDSEARVRAAEEARDSAHQSREAERAAREEAERRSNQYRSEADITRRSASEAQYDSVINAHAAAQGELASAKNSLKTAMAEGDFDKVAELSGEIGLIAARVREFENGKAALEARRNEQPQQPQSTGDTREDYIRARTPQTAAWLRRNDRFFTDRNFQMVVQGAHNLAVGRGIAPDSDDYFRFIEEQAGMRQPVEHAASNGVALNGAAPNGRADGGVARGASAPTSTAAATSARVSPMAAAPAAGTASSMTRANAVAGTVTLTPEEREYCRRDGVSETAYAKQKALLLSEGRIGVGH